MATIVAFMVNVVDIMVNIVDTPGMQKNATIKFFGTQANLARLIGCSRWAIGKWPDPLPRRIADRVIAACVRKGIDPTPLLEMEEGVGGEDERNQ